ncbi:MAG: methyltransferase domain-containing protein [Deltaproteobacteria bacterium]|nr:methyltransferase domain-containing protein [Deltaproteobacteria bacterium]
MKKQHETSTDMSGPCYVCGCCEPFVGKPGTSFREFQCPSCAAGRRNSDLARAIVRTFLGTDEPLDAALPRLQDLDIYEAQSSGVIHNRLRSCSRYQSSEYMSGIPNGTLNPQGIRCEDLESLTFPDNSFHLVITQDVMEHVRNPLRAFQEIKRVLKPGGFHIFTIPYHERKQTIKRAEFHNGETRTLLPPVHHMDPLNEKGVLVYNEFGEDILELLHDIGFNTQIVYFNRWYDFQEIPYLIDEKSYNQYIAYSSSKDVLHFFKYNSVVFLSQKPGVQQVKEEKMLKWTGERFLPSIDLNITGAEIYYEHLHRYAFASNFVKDKRVLDLASGEGYGSSLMAREALHVVGVEVDPDAVAHAKARYSASNLEFKEGSILQIPVQGRDLFDVVVCFEALEHITEHDALLSEVKRLCKEDGLFIASTPNKKIYSDARNYNNPFHVKELYLEEFRELLKKHFDYACLFGQQVCSGSRMWRMDAPMPVFSTEYLVGFDGQTMQFQQPDEHHAMYLIAVASHVPLEDLLESSYLVDTSNILTALRDQRLAELEARLAERDASLAQLQDLLVQRDASLAQLQDLLAQRDASFAQLEALLADRDSTLSHLKARVDKLDTQLEQVMNSVFWKATAPLRKLTDFFHFLTR